MTMAISVRDRAILRGAGWLLIAFIGAFVIGSGALDAWGVNEYTQRWLGACLKVGTGAWGGYRISRDVARIDPSMVPGGLTENARGYAMMHLARAIIIGSCILAVCLAV